METLLILGMLAGLAIAATCAVLALYGMARLMKRIAFRVSLLQAMRPRVRRYRGSI